MPPTDVLVSIGIPVRNGEKYLPDAIRSALAQDYPHLELVISDNASSDGTEQICRDFAATDPRVRYYRQPENIGLENNFMHVLEHSTGVYFKWLGDDDWMEPSYLTRCLELLTEDDALVLVTTQQVFIGPDGTGQTAVYDGTGLRSARPVERFAEMLRLVNESYLLLDPIYGLVRRAELLKIPRVRILREDEAFAAKLALAGPFGHVPEILAYRRTDTATRMTELAVKLGIPAWQARMATTLQCRDLLRYLRTVDLSPEEHHQARIAVMRLHLRRQYRTAVRRSRKLMALTRRP